MASKVCHVQSPPCCQDLGDSCERSGWRARGNRELDCEEEFRLVGPRFASIFIATLCTSCVAL